MKDYTITEIIELCKKFTKQAKQCKGCPVQIFCIKYFAGLPKYWKMPKESINPIIAHNLMAEISRQFEVKDETDNT